MRSTTDIRPYTRQFYRGNGFCLILAGIQILLFVLVNLAVSWLLQQVLDLIAGENLDFSLTDLALLALGLLALTGLCTFFDYISKPRFLSRAMCQYKEFVYEQLCKKSISAFSGENTALYISALSNDAAVIETGYLKNLFVIAEQALLFFGALVLMLWYSPMLTLISIVIAMLPILLSLVAGDRVATAEKKVSDTNESYMSGLKDSLMGFPVIKSFRAEVQMCRIFAKQVRQAAEAQCFRGKMTSLVEGLGAIASLILQIGVFLIGAWLVVIHGNLTVGTVMVFVQLLNYVLSPIGSIPQCLAERKAAKALIVKVAQALNENIREEGTTAKESLSDGIHVSELSFAYEPNQPVLQNIHFTFEAGKRYAIVGASGSGKSTLLNLLMASHSDYTGSIRYDDTDLKTISSEALYRLVSMVQQNVFIFNASIRDNITMFSQFPEDAVSHAIRIAGLADLIAQRGDDYLCGENGSGLSGGEKQRISIARSLLKESQVLLVDEATAALDAQTAWQVSNAILNLEGMTRIVVTHALDESLLRQYDAILTLKDGKLIETGTFGELMEQKGYFYSLFTVSQ